MNNYDKKQNMKWFDLTYRTFGTYERRYLNKNSVHERPTLLVVIVPPYCTFNASLVYSAIPVYGACLSMRQCLLVSLYQSTL